MPKLPDKGQWQIYHGRGHVPTMEEWPSGYELNAPRMYQVDDGGSSNFPEANFWP
jgi:hypothetical protein